jgi:hypothetical protein
MHSRNSICLACGAEMAPCLVRAASVRCHDCRDEHTPLRADLVERRLVLVHSAEPKVDETLEQAA